MLVLFKNLTHLEAEYLPYYIRVVPLIFSNLGIFVAYNTTSFLLNAQPHKKAFNSSADFQKNMALHELATHAFVVRVYTFFAQS